MKQDKPNRRPTTPVETRPAPVKTDAPEKQVGPRLDAAVPETAPTVAPLRAAGAVPRNERRRPVKAPGAASVEASPVVAAVAVPPAAAVPATTPPLSASVAVAAVTAVPAPKPPVPVAPSLPVVGRDSVPHPPAAARPLPIPAATPVAAVAAAKPASEARPVAAPVEVEPAKPGSDDVANPLAAVVGIGAEQARDAYATVHQTGTDLGRALSKSADVTARGLIELNSKLIDLVRAQSDATLAMWRSTLTAPSLSEAVRAQTRGARQAYEVSSSAWRDVAATATRIVGDAARPMQAIFAPRST